MLEAKNDNLQSYRWLVLFLTVLCFTLTQFARFTWPPLIPIIVPELGMNMAQAGKFMTAFYIGYIITMIPAGFLADKFGIRTLLSGSILLAGLSTLAMGYIDNYGTGFFYRVIAGLGSGAVYSCCTRAIVDWFPPKERGTAFGILLAGPSLGIILANYSVPLLEQAFGWKLSFKYLGIFIALYAFVLFFSLKTQANGVKGANKKFIDGLKFVIGHKGIRLVALAGFLLLWAEMSMAIFANAYIKSLGFSVKQAGLVMVFYGLGGVVGPFVSGVISDKIGHRKTILIISYLLIAPLTIIFSKQSSLINFNIVGFILGCISYAANPHLTVLVSNFAGREWAASANGTASFCFQMAPLLAPMLLGMVLDRTGNFSYVWYLMSIGPILGVIVLLFIKPETVD